MKAKPGAKAQPLEGTEAENWAKGQAMLKEMAKQVAVGNFTAIKLDELPQLDSAKILNAIHLPEDAGAYAAGLETILRRIPDGWGRWISCGAGWYPIIVELDQSIATIYPEYEVQQVKEKFGGLRYYCDHDGVDEVAKLIGAAELRAAKTCEDCGALGRLLDKGWLRTLCGSCGVKRGYLPAGQN
jgi:hypothetical protein